MPRFTRCASGIPRFTGPRGIAIMQLTYEQCKETARHNVCLDCLAPLAIAFDWESGGWIVHCGQVREHEGFVGWQGEPIDIIINDGL